MKIFRKSVGEYITFEQIVLVLVIVIGLLRLFLSIEGIPDTKVKWASVTALWLAGAVYYGIRVYTSGFGSYQHLLPLVFIQSLTTQIIIVFGILVGMITGKDNIYTVHGFTGPFDVGRSWSHIGGHLSFGLFIITTALFLISSLTMFIAKRRHWTTK